MLLCGIYIIDFQNRESFNDNIIFLLNQSKTGGLVVWRSGSSTVLYRGMTYKLPCVELYSKMNHAKENNVHVGSGSDGQGSEKEPVRATDSLTRDSRKYLKDMTEEELMELSDLNHLLDELGPRFKDWTGREPLPVDADLLPAVVPGYKTPLRLLPYGVKHCLSNGEMTHFRRLTRSMAPHFALGMQETICLHSCLANVSFQKILFVCYCR